MVLLDDSLQKLYSMGRIDRETALEHAFDRKALDMRLGGG